MNALQENITQRYDVVVDTVTIAGEIFSLVRVRDTNVLLDRIDPASFAIDERLPYWAELWPSSLELARYCMEEGGVAGLHVLEVGCGLGLAGIAAARAGAHVMMTDYDEDALLFARQNAAMNLPRQVMDERLTFGLLDWRAPPFPAMFDLLIGADVIYDRVNFAPLSALLHTVLRPGARAVFTDPGRATGESFFAGAAAHLHAEKHLQGVVMHGRESIITRMMLRVPL